MDHAAFSKIDLEALNARRLKGPHVPKIKSALDSSCFDRIDEESVTIPAYSGSQATFKQF